MASSESTRSFRPQAAVAAALLLATLGAGCAAMTPPAAAAKAAVTAVDARPPLAAAKPSRLAAACVRTGRELAARGQDEAALRQFERAGQFDPSRQMVRERAVLSGRLGREADARRLFEQAIATAPADADLLSDFGFFLYSVGDLAAAETRLREAQRLGGSAAAASNLACVLAASGRYEEARRLFAGVGAASEADRSVALLAARSGDAEAAGRFASHAAAADPDDAAARVTRASLRPAGLR